MWLLGHVQDPCRHQLPGEPVQPLVESHPAAGVAALDVPAPPAAQLVQAQQFRHLLHRHGAGNVLQTCTRRNNWLKTGGPSADLCPPPGYCYSSTCLLAKMSSRASLSSFSVSSLASSLWASISLSLWQLSITNTTAGHAGSLKMFKKKKRSNGLY